VCGLAAPLIFGVLGDAIGIEKAIFIAGVTVLLTLPLAWVLRAAIAKAPAGSAAVS